MKRLLVPTDFSACADNAINLAAGIAKVLSAEIVLLNVYEHAGSTYTDYVGLDKEFRATLMNERLLKLRQLQTSIKEAEGIPVSVVQYEGSVKESIIKSSADNNADMIVMGTLGNGGIKERLWGSSTAAVIGASKIPVVAVPIEYHGMLPDKILFTTNHFEGSPKVLDPLFELAAICMAQVYIASFSSESAEYAGMEDRSDELAEYGQKLKKNYFDKSLVTAHLSGDKFENAIEQYIDKNNIKLLTMVTYQRSFFERLLYPSMSKKLSYSIKVPLLVIPAEK
ncbi:MAG: universal stress protein [Chitinophagaceae bacterium]|nr:universal stress protein [Chitinophagaceae bacterium]